MNRESKNVVNPLIRWFRKQKPNWIIHKPPYETAATGWDIEARRKNQDLLVEAKYINGPFLSAFNGLVTAPLANRPSKLMKRKYRSWSFGICWAIGSEYKSRNIFQLIFDYFSRNIKFWKCYGKILRMKYVFFVEKGKVTKISWDNLYKLGVRYKKLKAPEQKLEQKRLIANKLMSRYYKS